MGCEMGADSEELENLIYPILGDDSEVHIFFLFGQGKVESERRKPNT